MKQSMAERGEFYHKLVTSDLFRRTKANLKRLEKQFSEAKGIATKEYFLDQLNVYAKELEAYESTREIHKCFLSPIMGMRESMEWDIFDLRIKEILKSALLE
jgi:predicted alpha/beta-fold hydrolase